MTRMIAAAEFKAAVREMLDGLGNEPLDADAFMARVAALVESVPAMNAGSLRGALAHPAYRFDDPFSPAYGGPWDAERTEEPRG